MPPLYERRQESLTTRAIIRAYEATYETVYNTKPECDYLGGNWFKVNGERHDRRWLLLEVECLRQTLIVETVNNMSSYTGNKRKAVSYMLRMLSKIN